VKELPPSEFEDFLGKYDKKVSRQLDLDLFMQEDEQNFNFAE